MKMSRMVHRSRLSYSTHEDTDTDLLHHYRTHLVTDSFFKLKNSFRYLTLIISIQSGNRYISLMHITSHRPIHVTTECLADWPRIEKFPIAIQFLATYDWIYGKRVLTYMGKGVYIFNWCKYAPKVAFGCYTFSERWDSVLSENI